MAGMKPINMLFLGDVSKVVVFASNWDDSYYCSKSFGRTMAEAAAALKQREFDVIFVRSRIPFTRFSHQNLDPVEAAKMARMVGVHLQRKREAEKEFEYPIVILALDNQDDVGDWIATCHDYGIPWVQVDPAKKTKIMSFFTFHGFDKEDSNVSVPS